MTTPSSCDNGAGVSRIAMSIAICRLVPERSELASINRTSGSCSTIFKRRLRLIQK